MSGSDDLSEDAIRDALQQNIDMSEYESQVYLALIRNGKQSMKSISEASDVPKQRVYDIVEDLRERGFIELDDSYPKKAYAVEPTKTLGPIQQQIEQVQTRLEELHKSISDIESGVAQFKNRATIRKYISELIQSADNTVFLLTPFDRLGEFEEELRSLEGVQIRLVLSDVDERNINDEEITVSRSFGDIADRVRGTPRSEPFVLCVDREQSFFWPNAPSSEEGFYVTDSELSLLFDRFLSDSVWPLAYMVNADEQQGAPDLPREYFRIRDCLADIQAISAKIPLESIGVSFEGYDTVSDEPVSMEGVLTGFWYSEYDVRASLEVAVESDDRQQTVSVGGWQARQEDYEAHWIKLERRLDSSPEGLESDTEAQVEECLRELPDKPTEMEAIVGFDGYIDHVRRLVGERKSPRMYDEIEGFDTVSEMFTRAMSTERTLQFEWLESDRLPGGHVAHAGQSLGSLGCDLRLVGYFGQPVRDEFETVFPESSLLSLGQPTVTEYLQFEDGKVLFTEGGSHQALNWETLCEYVPREDMADYLDDVDIVSIGGWPLIPEISTVWEGVAEEVYPMLDSPPADIIVIISDIQRISETRLRADFESLRALDDRIPITVVMTGEQAANLSETLLDGQRQQSHPARATNLREAIGVTQLAITTSREAVLANGGEPIRLGSFRIQDPAEEGTFEDHFTAGLAYGLAADISEESALVLASGVASFFQKHQETPTHAQLVDFLSTYTDTEPRPASGD